MYIIIFITLIYDHFINVSPFYLFISILLIYTFLLFYPHLNFYWFVSKFLPTWLSYLLTTSAPNSPNVIYQARQALLSYILSWDSFLIYLEAHNFIENRWDGNVPCKNRPRYVLFYLLRMLTLRICPGSKNDCLLLELNQLGVWDKTGPTRPIKHYFLPD